MRWGASGRTRLAIGRGRAVLACGVILGSRASPSTRGDSGRVAGGSWGSRTLLRSQARGLLAAVGNSPSTLRRCYSFRRTCLTRATADNLAPLATLVHALIKHWALDRLPLWCLRSSGPAMDNNPRAHSIGSGVPHQTTPQHTPHLGYRAPSVAMDHTVSDPACLTKQHPSTPLLWGIVHQVLRLSCPNSLWPSSHHQGLVLLF